MIRWILSLFRPRPVSPYRQRAERAAAAIHELQEGWAQYDRKMADLQSRLKKLDTDIALLKKK